MQNRLSKWWHRQHPINRFFMRMVITSVLISWILGLFMGIPGMIILAIVVLGTAYVLKEFYFAMEELYGEVPELATDAEPGESVPI